MKNSNKVINLNLSYKPEFITIMENNINTHRLINKSKVSGLNLIDNFLNSQVKRRKINKKTALQLYFDKIIEESDKKPHLRKGAIFLTSANLDVKNKKKYKVINRMSQIGFQIEKNIFEKKILSNTIVNSQENTTTAGLNPENKDRSYSRKKYFNKTQILTNIPRRLSINSRAKEFNKIFSNNQNNNFTALSIPKYLFYSKEEYNKINNVVTKEQPVIDYLNENFKSIDNSISKTYNREKENLLKDVKLEFNFTQEALTEENKFSERFRFKSKANKYHIVEKNYEPRSPTFNLHRILNNYKLRREVTRRIYKIRGYDLNSFMDIKKKFRKSIYLVSKQLKRLNIFLQDLPIYKNKEEELQPYKFKDSKLFFDAVKNNDIEIVFKMLYKNKLLLIDFDYSQQNILHWMVKRDFYQYLSQIIINGANINQQDYIGKTPLHLACEKNRFECVFILLYETANPFIKDNSKKTAFDYWKSNDFVYQYDINKIIKRVEILYGIHKEFGMKNFDKKIKNALLYLYTNELDIKLDFNDLNIEFPVNKKSKS